MANVLEMRKKRGDIWDKAKAYLDEHTDDKGLMNAEDTTVYERMEQDVVDLGHAIEREERAQDLERELNASVSPDLASRPERARETQKGIASDAYKEAFWKHMRDIERRNPELRNALQVGELSEGGYTVPDEFENTLIEGLQEENIMRGLAHVITTSSGDRKIPVVASKGTASWVDEEGTIPESDDAFGQVSIGAYKLATMIKVSEELLSDSVFNLERYIAKEFGRRIGAKEEEAFFVGDGTGKPTGIFHSTGGAGVGVTAASASAISIDEIMDLFYSLKSPYRKNAAFVTNDATIKAIRKLKDGNGQYLWQPSVTAGQPDSLLNRPLKTSAYVPVIASAAKTIAFGDFSYYWVADRQGRSFQRLNELFAVTGQVGFKATQRVDGKLILAEAVKVLQMKA